METDDSEELRQRFSKGYYKLLPTFYRLLIHLKRLNRDFTVVFRSFTLEKLHEVAGDFNSYAYSSCRALYSVPDIVSARAGILASTERTVSLS